MTPNILVAIPLHGSDIKIQCAVSLVAACSNLAARGMQFEIRYHSSAELVRNRNILASAALANQDRTHLLFVDGDMEFRPETLFRMLDLEKPVVGCIYPRRKPATSVWDFVVDLGDENQLQMANGAIPVRGLGMGLCLIQRTVLERLVATGEIRSGALKDHEGPVYGFFDPIAPDVSEDLSFCRRWASLCDGEIWALADEEIGHVGETTYKARFLDHVRTSTQTEPSSTKH